ncbi:MAG: hypothetical protein U0930_23220 [Pirellulales bacterium]
MKGFFALRVSTTLLLLLCSSSCLFSQFEGGYTRRESRGDGNWSQEEGGREANPVELPARSIQERLKVRWSEPTIDRLGNNCTIAGELYDPETDKVISWRQPITVRLERHEFSPSATSKWSEAETFEHECTKTQSNGRFSVTLDIRDLDRDITKAQVHRVFVTAGTQTVNGQQVKILWSSKDALLKLDQETLEIPANPELDKVQFLLNEAGKHENSYQPEPIIRAVNALHRLGKKNAVAAIEEHLNMLREGDQGSVGEDDHVFTILRILFEPIDPSAKFPIPGNFSAKVYGKEVEKEWPLNPIVLVGDIPFRYHCGTGHSGHPEVAELHLEFVKQSCVLRERPLKPTLNPIQAAELLCESQKIRLLDNNYDRPQAIDAIREQAISMFPEEFRKQKWNSVYEDAAKLILEWDDERGFVEKKE